MKNRIMVLAVLVAAAVLPAHAPAQQLSSRVTERCVRAAVKIVALSPDGRGSTGSGSIIDARGYILTNFHVVGHLRPRDGLPGRLIDPRNRVEIATVDSARQSARPRWVGAVVRGDTRLDLALVRIVSDATGGPVGNVSFPTVQMGSTARLRPGARLFALGFPLGVRTINLSSGSVTGFQMNARNQVAWIRSDAEFNPGNSGGMLVDDRGRLVAIPTAVVRGERTYEPIELARPIERLPPSWLRELRRGHLTDTVIDGVPILRQGQDLEQTALGDDAGLEDGREVHYIRLSPGDARPAVIRTQPRLPIGLVEPGGEMVRTADDGMIEVEESDPRGLVLAVVANAEDGAVTYRVRYEPAPARPAVAQAQPAPPPQPPPVQAQPAPPPHNPFVIPPGPPPAPGQIRPVGPPQAQGVGNASFLRGRMLDAMSGRPIAGMVIVGRPGLDIATHLQMFLAGRMDEARFEAQLVGFSRTDIHGAWEIPPLPRGQRYPGAGMAQGYRPSLLTITISPQDPPVVELNPIMMSR